MNAKLTPGIILIGVALATLAGCLDPLRNVTAAQLQDADYWLELAATGVRSFAVAAGVAISLVGTAMGLPQLFDRWKDAQPTPATTITMLPVTQPPDPKSPIPRDLA